MLGTITGRFPEGVNFQHLMLYAMEIYEGLLSHTLRTGRGLRSFTHTESVLSFWWYLCSESCCEHKLVNTEQLLLGEIQG